MNYFDEGEGEEIDFENESQKSIATILLEKLKCNCDSNDGLLLFNDETIEHLRQFYTSIEKEEVDVEEVDKNPTVMVLTSRYTIFYEMSHAQ